MEFTWNLPGIHLESTWNLSGIHLESSGIMESIWNLVEWWWNPDGHSRWNLAILCGFYVEYKWNGITKKSGIPAKIYSIWNE